MTCATKLLAALLFAGACFAQAVNPGGGSGGGGGGGTVDGSGTNPFLPYWVDSNTLGSSSEQDNGSLFTIGLPTLFNDLGQTSWTLYNSSGVATTPTTGYAPVCQTVTSTACAMQWGAVGSGTVTSVATDATLTGGPITSSGTLGIASSAALPGNPTTTNPTLTDISQEIATTSFVNALISTLNPNISVAAATVAVLSNTPTYNNGAGTLTAGSNGALTVDGYTVALNDQILVNNQASAFQNGVYDLTTLGDGSTPYVLTRDPLFNTAALINGSGGIPITGGSTNASTIATLNAAVATLGTSAINYTLLANTTTNNKAVPHSVTFNLNGNGGTIATGATNQYIESEVASTSGIYKVVTTGTATSGPANCSITVDIWKRNAAIPSSSQKISASAPATLSSAQYAVNTTNTGWTKKVNPGDVWSASVASVTGCVSATVQVWWK